jgi:hypothetical protein
MKAPALDGKRVDVLLFFHNRWDQRVKGEAGWLAMKDSSKHQ